MAKRFLDCVEALLITEIGIMYKFILSFTAYNLLRNN